MMRVHAIVPALVVAAAVAGCGGAASSADKFDGEANAVADVAEELQSAAARRDGARICSDLLAKELVDRIAAGGSSCTKELERALEDADDSELEVLRVDVRGTDATARVRGGDGDGEQVASFTFEKEQGKWRVTSLRGG